MTAAVSAGKTYSLSLRAIRVDVRLPRQAIAVGGHPYVLAWRVISGTLHEIHAYVGRR